MTTYHILVKKRTIKDIEKLPAAIQKKLAMLIDDLKERGPIRSDWPNFSKLGKDTYHCHLAHKWVV